MNGTQVGHVSKPKPWTIAFILDEQDLNDLSTLIRQGLESLNRPTDLEYPVSLSTGERMVFGSVRQLKEDQTLDPQEIKSVWITTPETSSTQVAVEFNNELPSGSESAPVRYQVAGPATDVAYLSDVLDRRIPRMRRWYSRIIFTPRAIFLQLLGFFVLFLVGYYSGQYVVGPLLPETIDPGLGLAILFTSGAAIGIAVGVPANVLANYLINKIMPVGFFAIRRTRPIWYKDASILGFVGGIVGFVSALIGLATALIS